MASRARRRVTVDLRGLDDRLAELAARRCVTAAAVVRGAVLSLLEGDAGQAAETPPVAPGSRHGQVVKVTVRLPRSHAVLLARRSRAACVSLGDYVCGLLDDVAPVEVPREVAFMLSSLDESTDRLAAISADLGTLLRHAALPDVPVAEPLEGHVTLSALRAEIRDHLARVAQLLRDLEPLRRSINAAARADAKRSPR